MEWCGVFMMGLWASGLRSLRPLASTHSVPRLTTPSFSPHINPFRKNSKLKQNILWFGLSFVQISCRKIRSFPFLIDFHSFLPKRARKYHFELNLHWRIFGPIWNLLLLPVGSMEQVNKSCDRRHFFFKKLHLFPKEWKSFPLACRWMEDPIL